MNWCSTCMEADGEIEALRSIFGDDIAVETNHDRSIKVVRRKVRPDGEEGVSPASIVVEFQLSLEYPQVSPTVRLLNPRGISEQSHQRLCEEVQQLLSDNIGMPIIYDVMQHCADFILEHQHSSSLACPICLCSMTSASVYGTHCDHYCHTECYKLHVEHTRKQLGDKLLARGFKMCDDIDRSLRCPVCREVIEEEVEPLLQPFPSERQRKSDLDGLGKTTDDFLDQGLPCDFEFDWERWRKQQARLMEIYERQKEKGGIIDLEEERKKNLVTENTVVVLGSEMGNLEVDHSSTGTSATPLVSSLTHTRSSDMDIPPGFENTIPIHATANVFPKGRLEHFHRGRGGGRRPSTGRLREGGRWYDYGPKQRRETQGEISQSQNASSNAASGIETACASARNDSQSVTTKRGERGSRAARRSYHQKGNWREHRAPRGQSDVSQQTVSKIE